MRWLISKNALAERWGAAYVARVHAEAVMSFPAETAPQPDYHLGFQSLDREVAEVRLPVEGELPDWLGGSLIRTGPARFEVGAASLAHWFDGLAMLHAFRLGRGEVVYSNRFLRSHAYCAASGQGRLMRSEFMSDPCRTLFGRVMTVFDPKPTDNGSVNVAMVAGRMAALTETPMPVAFDPITLETLGHVSADPSIAGQIGTAHPHHDGDRAYWYSIAIGRRSSYRLIVEERGMQRIFAEVPVDEPAYMHSFGMSERYLVLTEFPLRVHPLRLALSSEPFIRRYRWQPGRGTVITVVDKNDGSIVAKARAAPFFAFHHVNAFEDGDDLLVDILAYDDASVIEDLRLARLRSGQAVRAAGRMTRLRVPLGGAGAGDVIAVESEQLSAIPLELPRIDYARRAGRRHRMVWGAGQSAAGNFLDNITRLEFGEDGGVDARTWQEAGCYPGEPVLVSRPDSAAEDDGVLLSVVLDAAAGRSFLLVLDAATLKERVRAIAPHHIPFGFHGNHFPEIGATPR